MQLWYLITLALPGVNEGTNHDGTDTRGAFPNRQPPGGEVRGRRHFIAVFLLQGRHGASGLGKSRGRDGFLFQCGSARSPLRTSPYGYVHHSIQYAHSAIRERIQTRLMEGTRLMEVYVRLDNVEPSALLLAGFVLTEQNEAFRIYRHRGEDVIVQKDDPFVIVDDINYAATLGYEVIPLPIEKKQ